LFTELNKEMTMTTQPVSQTTNPFTTLLKRPEVLAFITALAVTAFNAMSQKTGLQFSAEALNAATAAFWAVFIGAVFEGRYKGRDYETDLKNFLTGLKFQTAFVSLLAVLATGAFNYLEVPLPEAVTNELASAIYIGALSLIGLKAAIDGNAAAQGKGGERHVE
jgi:hypothetical protein